nr:PREDICTED: retinol dehydrogenase 12-like [Bemisia tabaci]XP_018907784.1 PREDICTED: retinol dehydrogenase 12-like [Bemisia tabaci]
MCDVFIWAWHYLRDGAANSMTCVFGGKCKSKARLDGKVVVITGCNTGIGRETALELYKRGARVIMACRNLEKAKSAERDIKHETKGLLNVGEIVVKELNLASFKSIRKCADDILASEKHIHFLVNNAGVFACPRELTEDGHELQFGTNHLGHFLFTLLLLPRIIRSAPARIVTIASLAHMWGDGKMHYDDITLEKSYSPTDAYGRSKLANIFFTTELARKLEGTGVTTYSLHPGLVHTDLFRHLDKTVSPTFQDVFLSRCVTTFLKSSRQGAETTLHCCLDEKAGKESGLYYCDCKPRIVMKRARDQEKAKELWEYSWNAVSLPKDYDPFVKG